MHGHGSSRPLLIPPPATAHRADPFDDRSRSDAAAERHAPRGKTRGLCATCERRVDCSFPVREQDVWFCEEYE